MLEHVPPHLLHAYNLYDRTAKTGITNTCNYPHKVVTIDTRGECMLCGCDGWLPISAGKIESFNNLEDVWQTDVAKQLQQDIDSKKFTWCSVDACGIRQENRIKQRYFISVNIDESCNLACPSCRRSKINRTSGNEYESRLFKTRHLVKLINKFDHPVEIMMSGNGDPFASLIYRPLLMEMEPRDNVKIRMLTNGLLLKKLLPSMKIKQSIKRLDISIDAGDKETYEKVRLGGKWNVLMENLDYIKENVDCKVTLFFVLQKDNIDSVDNFVRLMEQYGFNGNIMPIENWGAMDNFAEHDVFASDHPMNARVKDVLVRYGNHPGLFFHSINKF
jgi:wyosine [tRNA(Phe)-imidazoG37] synthetase (radical SAM superfamily)